MPFPFSTAMWKNSPHHLTWARAEVWLWKLGSPERNPSRSADLKHLFVHLEVVFWGLQPRTHVQRVHKVDGKYCQARWGRRLMHISPRSVCSSWVGTELVRPQHSINSPACCWERERAFPFPRSHHRPVRCQGLEQRVASVESDQTDWQIVERTFLSRRRGPQAEELWYSPVTSEISKCVLEDSKKRWN